MPRDDFRFVHSMRVRWSEVDPQGIVFNPNYLVYFDVAGGEYWREIGCVYPAAFTEHGVDTFAVKTGVEFRNSAKYDDVIDVLVRVVRIGNTSLAFAFEVHRGADLLVVGEMISVVASVAERKPTPIPDFLRSAIVGYERVPPEQRVR